MLTQSPAAASLNINRPVPGGHAPAEPFCGLAGHAGLIATEFTYRKDEEIYGEDEPAEYVYQVIRGAVRTYKLLADGRRQIGAFHLPGDVFGLESGAKHRLAAEAIIDTTVRLVKRRSLEQAASTDVQVAHKLWTMTAGDLKHAEEHMLLLGRKSAMERVANFLLEMDRRLAVAGMGMMALPMCRRDIGDYLGLTLETVSRALSQLNDEGVLGFSGARQIVLRNRQRLRNMDV
ncbi:helix-turn-helix domain-containing protein [Bradyrhizobium sp. Arg237L]|uniref:helix-turn-helix domain-containing protein n=1 Tax=Bradyrhizobium sp. Arg237L TaxID=3003352 RepID=UPI00249DA6B5|nr:helix-turn-helix domain-containing protein [Bradyrhizobium sp. Arg237L]MDI4231292.1 helix-turn-helix domain-containing protein [Bradyrhizobium sp. Arg237L]